MKKILKTGRDGFGPEYWNTNYAEPMEMDNIFNCKEHVSYLHSILSLSGVEINSVIDFGFGLGVLFQEILNKFLPYKTYGIEPSEYIFNQVLERNINPSPNSKFKLDNIDLVTWAKNANSKKSEKIFDLGVCTSVFQYLSEEELDFVVPMMAQKTKYLYLSVPTDLELKNQIENVEFKDEYAIHRKKEYYLKLIRPHFTIVSSRLLESKIHFDEDSTLFTDLLFRF